MCRKRIKDSCVQNVKIFWLWYSRKRLSGPKLVTSRECTMFLIHLKFLLSNGIIPAKIGVLGFNLNFV